MNHPRGPFPPVKAGLSPLVIALIAIGGTLAVGGASCLVVGGLVLAAAADGESSSAAATAPATATAAAPAPAPAPEPEPESEPATASPPAVGAATGAATAAAPASPAAPPGNWSCTASASVRVCGFANACNMQMVFGNGFGKDRFLASQQAKSSCEAMARAKGASAVCIVQCTVR